MDDEFGLLDQLKDFILARYREQADNPSVDARDRAIARDGIKWIAGVVIDVKSHGYALNLGVQVLAKHARRFGKHPDYDPLWGTIEIDT